MADRAGRWRARAAEIRQLAETARDPVVQALLRGLAEEYERLAKRAAAEKPRTDDEGC